MLPDGRVGRFGWKADVPSLAEFSARCDGGRTGTDHGAAGRADLWHYQDNDGVTDPELTSADGEDALFFMSNLAPPPRSAPRDAELRSMASNCSPSVGCAKCHIPSMPGAAGRRPALFRFAVARDPARGTQRNRQPAGHPAGFRTAPLWGLSNTSPYFPHRRQADTVDEAIRLHDGEAAAIRAAYEGTSRRGSTRFAGVSRHALGVLRPHKFAAIFTPAGVAGSISTSGCRSPNF